MLKGTRDVRVKRVERKWMISQLSSQSDRNKRWKTRASSATGDSRYLVWGRWYDLNLHSHGYADFIDYFSIMHLIIELIDELHKNQRCTRHLLIILLVAEIITTVFILDCPMWIYSIFVLFIIPAKTIDSMTARDLHTILDIYQGMTKRSHTARQRLTIICWCSSKRAAFRRFPDIDLKGTRWAGTVVLGSK